MRLLNKKGYISPAPMYIGFIIVFIIFTFNSWRNMPNHNEISFWSVLLKYSFWLFICIVILSTISFIVEFIGDYIYTHKDWLKFYEGKVSEITIKSLIDKVDNYDLIEKRALDIFKSNCLGYSFIYYDKIPNISQSEIQQKEIFKKFKEMLPSILNAIRKSEYISFDENKYSTLTYISISSDFVNISKGRILLNREDINIKQIANTRIMNDIIEKYSIEEILSSISLDLFMRMTFDDEKYEEIINQIINSNSFK